MPTGQQPSAKPRAVFGAKATKIKHLLDRMRLGEGTRLVLLGESVALGASARFAREPVWVGGLRLGRDGLVGAEEGEEAKSRGKSHWGSVEEFRGGAKLRALAGACATSSGPNVFVQQANSSRMPFGSMK